MPKATGRPTTLLSGRMCKTLPSLAAIRKSTFVGVKVWPWTWPTYLRDIAFSFHMPFGPSLSALGVTMKGMRVLSYLSALGS